MKFNQLRDLFIFSRTERNGVLVLLMILLLLICVDISLPYLIPVQEYDVAAWKKEAEEYYARTKTVESHEIIIPDTAFSPNAARLPDLVKIGVPGNLAANWIKYLQKGGVFKKKEEVLKLFGMTQELYNRIEKYLALNEANLVSHIKVERPIKIYRPAAAPFTQDSRKKPPPFVKKSYEILEINTADSAQLESLPGIGPVLASRIVKYRRLLGGFYNVSQLREIYGMSEELWTKSTPWLHADPAAIKKLEINFLNVTELGRHPYIGFRQAKKIVKQRDKNGKFKDSEEIAAIFSRDSLEHLAPYLSIGNQNP